MDTAYIAKLERQRFQSLLAITLGYALWMPIINMIQPTAPITDEPTLFVLVGGIALVGWLLFVFGLYRMFRLGKRIKHNPMLYEVFNDEHIRLSRMRAFQTGFAAFIIAGLLIIGSNAFISLPLTVAMNFVLFVGVEAALIHGLIIFKPVGWPGKE